MVEADDKKDSARLARESQRASALSQSRLRQNAVHVNKGECIYREGDSSTDLYLLMQGEVVVSKRGEPIAVINEPLSYFGEISALLGEPRAETVEVTRESEFLKVPAVAIEQVIDFSPAIGKRILRSLSQRIHQMAQAISAMDERYKAHKQRALDEALAAVVDYKRLMYVLALVYKDRREPFLKEILEFSKATSKVNNYGIRLDVEMRDFARFEYLRKLVEGELKRPAASSDAPAAK
ncbi:MAG: cyclic nucleotide-binding domain-containing protein [Planctomycetes bacterium]|nr:cyclic nucleotide-binding domain-containing protein [Planctomycetota bacterium]